MRNLRGEEIRELWLKFWQSHGHEVINPAPLVPENDPSLLWINSGVATLKKYFDGREKPLSPRMCSVQRSIRTNDIENVGLTARHHTFFEMLGNFSIGDYFRKDAIYWAFEFLTHEKYLALPVENLYFTIYPEDFDAERFWKELGIKDDHIIKLENNFWEIGEGPCGPNTEVFYDRGEKYDPLKSGVNLLKEEIENDRYIEIWGIVFSQFNAKTGVERKNYEVLPSKNIDTGMGLERVACILQETPSNYETDLFLPIINEIEKISGKTYKGDMAFRVIADHIRTIVFALSDGASFANEGRGYVLRRLLRRAMRFGKNLGILKPFLKDLVEVVIMIMKKSYPYLVEKATLITNLIENEEEKFLLTLASGEKKLTDILQNKKVKELSGEVAFLLYDTFGFPLELTIEVAEEFHKTVDTETFNKLLQNQKQKSKSARSFDQSMHKQNKDVLHFKEKSTFTGYNSLSEKAKIIGIFKDGKSIKKGKGDLVLVFDKTPFYATSGGQNADFGVLEFDKKKFNIVDGFVFPHHQNASLVKNVDEVFIGKEVNLTVNKARRESIMRNHSATHLLNEALRKVIGAHVRQQGSLVEENYLRFDFNSFNALTDDDLLAIEDLVNLEIALNKKTLIKEQKLKIALQEGVQALFNEKYDDVVRVVEIGFSKELCGGTHVKETGFIGAFAISKCESKGSGIFRIEASTSDKISENIEENSFALRQEINSLREHLDTLKLEIKQYSDEEINILPKTNFVKSYRYFIGLKKEKMLLVKLVKDLEKKLNELVLKNNTFNLDEFLPAVKLVKNDFVVVFDKELLNDELAKDLIDRLSDKYKPGIIVLAATIGDKLKFFVKSTTTINAGNVVKELASFCDGAGGGRPDFAQGSGKNKEKLKEALKKTKQKLGVKD